MAIVEGPNATGGTPPGYDDIANDAALPPPGLTLLQVHHFARHGERTPVVRDALPALSGRGSWTMCPLREFEATVMRLTAGEERTGGRLSNVRLARQVSVDGQAREDVAGPSECGMGELTALGRLSTYRLGQALRKLYVDRLGFLSATPTADEIQLRSTDVPRTIASLQQTLAGFLPTSTTFKPVIEIRDAADESLQFNVGKCAHLAAMHGRFVTATARRHNPSLAALDERLNPHLREPLRIDGKLRAVWTADSIWAARVHGVEGVPAVFQEPEVAKTVERAIVHEWFDGYDDAEFKRLAAGRMCYDLLAKLKAKVTKGDSLKLGLNACHDTTIGAWLHVLTGQIEAWPPFTSHITFELFSRPSSSFFSRSPSHYVRAKFQGRPLRMPACSAPANQLEGSDGTVCTYEAFRSALEKVAMSKAEWREGCGKVLEADKADARVAAVVKQAMAG